jgi:hypothetical protein
MPCSARTLITTLGVAAAAGCLGAGCFGGGGGGDGPGSPHLDLDTIGPIAVGRAQVVYLRVVCTDPQIGEVTCPGVSLAAVDQVTVSDTAVATVDALGAADGEGQFTVMAAAAGSAVVTVRAHDSDGHELTVSGAFDALVPDRLELVMGCDAFAASRPPWPVAVSESFRITPLLYQGETYLYGGGPFPLDAGPFEVVAFFDELVLRAPATPVLGTITSPVDPTARLDVQVYDLAGIDGLFVRPIGSPAEPLALEGKATRAGLETIWTVGGVEPCVGDRFFSPTVSVYVGSQVLCGLDPSGGWGIYQLDGLPPAFSVWADFEGSCTGSVTLEDNGAVGSFSVEFASPVPARGGRWKWENPLPQGQWLLGVNGSGDNDVWAVGLEGAIVHWDGVGWSVENSPTDETLTDVWASGANDAWAVSANGAILHWDLGSRARRRVGRGGRLARRAGRGGPLGRGRVVAGGDRRALAASGGVGGGR